MRASRTTTAALESLPYAWLSGLSTYAHARAQAA